MNIELIISKIIKAQEVINKNLADITATITTVGVVYFNYVSKMVDSLFSIGTAILSAVFSYLAVLLTKHVIKKIKEK